MDGSTDGCDGRIADRTTDADAPLALETVVVRYENQPDRGTIVPRGRSDEETVTTWFTANLDSFVDLDEAR